MQRLSDRPLGELDFFVSEILFKETTNKQVSRFFPLFRPTTSPHRRLARLAAKVRQQAREVSGDVEGDG